MKEFLVVSIYVPGVEMLPSRIWLSKKDVRDWTPEDKPLLYNEILKHGPVSDTEIFLLEIIPGLGPQTMQISGPDWDKVQKDFNRAMSRVLEK